MAENNPESPAVIHEAGFHSMWGFSSTFNGLGAARAGAGAAPVNLDVLKGVVGLHPGFTEPSQVGPAAV